MVVAALWAAVATASPTAAGPIASAASAKADSVLVLKSQRRLVLLADGLELKSYRVALGRNPVGAKRIEGDGRTPEGRYRIDWRNAESRFHRSLHISYPDASNRRHAARLGLAPGDAIMIHGLSAKGAVAGPEHVRWDWTDGCIAVTNAEIEEIWSLVNDGTPIEIRP